MCMWMSIMLITTVLWLVEAVYHWSLLLDNNAVWNVGVWLFSLVCGGMISSGKGPEYSQKGVVASRFEELPGCENVTLHRWISNGNRLRHGRCSSQFCMGLQTATYSVQRFDRAVVNIPYYWYTSYWYRFYCPNRGYGAVLPLGTLLDTMDGWLCFDQWERYISSAEMFSPVSFPIVGHSHSYSFVILINCVQI